MNKWIYILLYLSLAFAISVILFYVGIVPPIFGKADNAEEINNVLVNLSFSYLAGYIFYVLIEVLPTWSKSKKAMDFVGPRLKAIYSDLDYILVITKLEAGLNKNNQEIQLEDCAFADQMLLESKKVAVLTHIRTNGKKWSKDPLKEWYDTVETQREFAENVKKKIDDIQRREIYSYLDDSLKFTIDSIYSSKYLSTLKSNYDYFQLHGVSQISVYNGKKSLFDFIQLLEKLKTYSFDIQEHKILKMSKEEEKEYWEIVSQLRNTHSNFTDYNYRLYKGNIRFL